MMGHASERANTFEVDKAVAALAFLVEQTSESMYSLLKMMYLADKLHLQRYGRFIAGDRYCAMQQGPVPSNAYAIFQHLKGTVTERQFETASRYLNYLPDRAHAVALVSPPDLEELSAGELDCLATIVETYRKFGKWAVRDMSHDEAWRHTWLKRIFRASIPMEIAGIARQFENSESLLRHLDDPHPGEAEISSPGAGMRRVA